MAGGFAEQLAKAASKKQKQKSQKGASLSSSFAEQLRQRAADNCTTEGRLQNITADDGGAEKDRGTSVHVSISPTHTATSALKTVTPTTTQTVKTLLEDDRKSDGVCGDDCDGASHVSAASSKASKRSSHSGRLQLKPVIAVPGSLPQCSQEGNIKVRGVERDPAEQQHDTNKVSPNRRVDSPSKLQQQLQRASRALKPSPSKVVQCSADKGEQDESVFGAWAQIESLKQRVIEAEERAMSESQRADEISAELRAAKGAADDRGTVRDSHVYSSNDSACEFVKVRGEETRVDSANDESADEAGVLIPSESATASQHHQKGDDAEQWKRRALEAEHRLVLEGRLGLPAREGPALYDDEEDSEIINLKNKEIAVLRKQIMRLEKLVADERERALYVQDGPLVFASECSLTADSSQTPSTAEFRLLRNEIRSLQFQLRSKEDRNSAVSMSAGSTLSSLDNDDRNSTFENDTRQATSHPPLRAQVIVRGDGSGLTEEQEELVPDESTTQSSWNLCACIARGSRKGYGRV